MTSRLIMIIAFLASAAYAPIAFYCGTGCTKSTVAPWSEIEEITWTVVTPLSMGGGLCYYDCSTDPCTIDGKLKLSNGTASQNVYIRGRVNTVCVPGTITVPAGQSSDWFEFDNQALDCGVTYNVYVYTSDPGSSCTPGGACAAFGVSCSGCAAVQG